MTNKFDYYNTIGLTPKASPDDIKSAFREKAKRYHPDINKMPEAEEIFKRINEAYQVLSDPIKRKQYDAVNREIKEKAERIIREEWIRQDTVRQDAVRQAERIRREERIRQGTENKIPSLVILDIIVGLLVMAFILGVGTSMKTDIAIPISTPTPVPVVSNDYIFDIDRGAGIILYKKGDCIITAMIDTNANEDSGICAGNDWDSFRKEVKKIKSIVEIPIPTPKPTLISDRTKSISPIDIQEPLLPARSLNTNWNPPIVPSDLNRAYADYEWRIILVNEQTERVTTYYSIKSGIKMDKEESYVYMETSKKLLEEFIKRNKDAIYSGDNYAKLININIGNLNSRQSSVEIWRINKNKETFTNDINIVITGYNQQVESYNEYFRQKRG